MPVRHDTFHSEEAQSILGRAPSWVVRWGVTVVFCIFGGILLGCYFIKYPDTIEAPAVITTVNPPSDLVARYDGLIDTLCVSDRERVERGELIAVLRNAAKRQDVERLSAHLRAADTLAPAAPRSQSVARRGICARGAAIRLRRPPKPLPRLPPLPCDGQYRPQKRASARTDRQEP